jgi:hypothetical protein
MGQDTGELARLRHSEPVEDPPGEIDSIEVACNSSARALARVQSVLETVLSQSEASWPEVDEWARMLPDWFVKSCVDDRKLQDCVLDQWSLRAWIYWFQPAYRKWRWWDAEEIFDGGLRVRVLVLERPYLRGALEWLIKVAAN